MNAAIEVTAVRKRFGPVLALDGMSFAVMPGRVTGFIGPNGAGKSTTMRVILGLDAPDEGRALVGGRPYRSLERPLTHLGSLLDASALQPGRTGRNHLLWLAHSQGLDARRADRVAVQAGLETAIRRKAGGYSLGMRQRLGIAAALLGDPPALMFDEPFNGMDPEGIIWMRAFLASLAGQGRAVLVSSHLMSELEDTADHLVIVGRGKVIADTDTAGLLARVSGGRVMVRTTAASQAASVLARAGAAVTPSGPQALTVSGLPAERVVAVLSGNGVAFSELAAHRASLEEAYLQLTADAAGLPTTAQARLADGQLLVTLADITAVSAILDRMGSLDLAALRRRLAPNGRWICQRCHRIWNDVRRPPRHWYDITDENCGSPHICPGCWSYKFTHPLQPGSAQGGVDEEPADAGVQWLRTSRGRTPSGLGPPARVRRMPCGL